MIEPGMVCVYTGEKRRNVLDRELLHGALVVIAGSWMSGCRAQFYKSTDLFEEMVIHSLELEPLTPLEPEPVKLSGNSISAMSTDTTNGTATTDRTSWPECAGEYRTSP